MESVFICKFNISILLDIILYGRCSHLHQHAHMHVLIGLHAQYHVEERSEVRVPINHKTIEAHSSDNY